jgi:hypothetical protein
MSAANFPPNSRYLTTDTTVFTTADGRAIAYLRRRFLPDPAVFFVAQRHTVTGGERLDNIALRPEDLTAAVGRVLDITLPAGLPGPIGA